MPDREKVIKGLECCRDRIKDDLLQTDEPCNSCPYAVNGNVCSPWELYDDAITMLKEQEPKPVGKEWNECPSCGKTLDKIHDMHYCGVCGQEVKWDE